MRVGVLGLGHIGGSIARAVDGAIGWDADDEVRGLAADAGIDVTTPVSEADLVVVATPLDRLHLDVAAVLDEVGRDGSTVTDVASVKGPVLAAAAGHGAFVPGHPMAGTERSGWGASSAGLFVDAWAEVIPSAEHTAGVAFHYDAPGARPPQAIVLAVHPDLPPERWNLQYLLETVQETISLARLRTITLREIDGMAGLIPALFLPNNYTRDVASVSFKGLVTAAQAAKLGTVHTGIRGKS